MKSEKNLVYKSVILAIESSCDDTSAAVLADRQLLSNVVANQKIHEKYGGVVPEVASRAHLEHIIPVVDQAIKEAKIEKSQISAIAVTRGPGLMGSLLVGNVFAKSLAYSLGIPILDVHHMQAHILAHFIEKPCPSFPFLCLTVSGGHTQIVKIVNHLEMTILGETIDDAAGEAFDKTGKMLGLTYPAGPQIDNLAQLGKPVFKFPEPKIDGLNFSFSGLKTSILYFLKRQLKENPEFIQENLHDLCASIQHRIVTILINKLEKAAREENIQHIAIAGGVSANTGLRTALTELGKHHGWQTYIPKFQFCTDNAAMIAITGHFKYQKGQFADQTIAPSARMNW
ncbi:MAG: tRNA (adenosine(37)-N6)-threonylcarbamoyltransferase complex transferase subunit TsaD [Bacteroidia bacterium]|nr:tRNA (adenosine(37)-N6)-threonylcarbamoyltransferase complex transferase subunit TsaD [Bacteroidia bacterium]